MKIEETVKKLKEFVKGNKLPLETVIKMVKTFEDYADEEMIGQLVESQGLVENKEFLKHLEQSWEGKEDTLIRSSYTLRKLQFDKCLIKGDVLKQLETDENYFDYKSMRIDNLLSLIKLQKSLYSNKEVEYLDLKRQAINELSKEEYDNLMPKIDNLETLYMELKKLKPGIELMENYLKDRNEEIAKLGYLLG